jgi:drug/metabolite transporter (DMT)-like permease
MTPEARAGRGRLIAAFAAVYVIWGSTYLAIRYAIATIPPFLMAGTRFVASGAVLYAWARARGGEAPSRAVWRAGAITGLVMLFGGNGGVVWAEQRVPSGITALLVAVVPLWMVLMEWLRPGGRRPHSAVFVGLVLGLVGIVLLVGPGAIVGHGNVDTIGAATLMFASVSWAAGSIYSRHAARPSSAVMATALQMLTGGVVFLIAALVTGELARFDIHRVTLPSALGFSYLVTFGSLVGFTAYVYLLRSTTPAKAATYAYVNPVVAVILGWAIAGEPISWRTLVAAAVILAGVAIITIKGATAKAEPEKAARSPQSAPRARRVG